MAVAAPADKRFRRAHASPVRRRRRAGVSLKRVAQVGLLTVLLLYAGYRGTDLLMATEALTVTRITVSGNVVLSEDEVAELVDGLHGRNMVLLGLEEWRQKLLTSPWVADAAVRRVLPGTVNVLIAEREPIGVARIDRGLYLVDDEGAVIDEFGPGHAAFDLPLIDGLAAAAAAVEEGEVVDGQRAALAARLMSSLDEERPDLAARVSQIDVSDLRDAVVMLKGDTALVRVGDEAFVERLESYLELAPALRERVPAIDYVDVRFGQRVYVRPQASGPRPQGDR